MIVNLSFKILFLSSIAAAFNPVGPHHRHGTERPTTVVPSIQHLLKSSLVQVVKKWSLAACFTASTVLTPVQINLWSPQTPIISITSSTANALTEQQLLVADAWKEVTRQYIDTTYNGLGEEGWKQKRLDAVRAVTNVGPDDRQVVYDAIRNMLSALNDPYTRFLTPEQFASLTAYARGDSAGIGVSLIVDPKSGAIVVASTAPDGPASKAGIVPGDILVEVDGMDVLTGTTAEVAAAKCRGEVGTNLNIVVRHEAARKDTPLTITRAKVQVNPVVSSTVTIDGKKIGVLKVSAFSQETIAQMVDALRKFQNSPVSAIALDLRGNAGGYMPAGVDAAKLFLQPQTRIISEVDKSGRKTIYIADGIGSETEIPIYLLVDQRTASASEILTAALQDNKRATVVGSSKTFGKGRIQNVQALEDGGIAVTKAKYLTPAGNRDIHGVGITPDKISANCGPTDSAVACLAPALVD